MGIKNLIKLIDKYAKDAKSYKKINDYKGKILGIDANLMIYKMIFAIRKNGYDLQKGENVVTHIHTINQKLVGFRKYNITPIFVFDSGIPEIKEHTMKTRKEFHKIMQSKYNKAVTQDEKKKYYFMKSDITQKEIDDIKKLITIFGYQIIDSIEEADAELANLSKKGLIDGIVTDDMDILVFGGKLLIKNFSISDKRKIQQIELDKILIELNINMNQFIDICVMIGCDYCPGGTTGIGPIKSYELIKKHKRLENVVKSEKISKNISLMTKAVNYFKDPPKTKNIIIKPINKFKAMEFVKFLENNGYTLSEINELLKKID